MSSVFNAAADFILSHLTEISALSLSASAHEANRATGVGIVIILGVTLFPLIPIAIGLIVALIIHRRKKKKRAAYRPPQTYSPHAEPSKSAPADDTEETASDVEYLPLHEILRRKRNESGMTQEFIAEMLGVSRQAVSKWENGTSDPSTSNLLALCRLYGISPSDLLRNVKL